METAFTLSARPAPGAPVPAPRWPPAGEFDLRNRLRHRQRLEALGGLTGCVAHDINNLLAVILCNSEQLLAGSNGGLEKRLKLSQIAAAGGRARDLVAGLLRYIRKDSTEEKART